LRAPEFRWGAEEPRREVPWRLVLLAVLCHGWLLFAKVYARPPAPVRPPRELVAIAPLEADGRVVPVPVPSVVPEVSRGVRAPRAEVVAPPPERERPPADTSRAAVAPDGVGRRGLARLGPGLGEGRLWVDPLPLPPRELASALTRRPAAQVTDNLAQAVVQAYLDSIAHDPDVLSLRRPSWVATLDGKKYGIDASHIYVAGLRIPTAVLALLPIKASGNQAYLLDHRLEAMAYDLRVAGRRSDNLQEFKEAVREMRQRAEADREFERNQRTAPGDSLVGRREE
jgi:hypothetical protein